MMMKHQIFLTALIISLCICAYAQENVFQLFRKEIDLADLYYKNKEYHSAYKLYDRLYRNDSARTELSLKMARCAYYMKEYRTAAFFFQKNNVKDRTTQDQFCLA